MFWPRSVWQLVLECLAVTATALLVTHVLNTRAAGNEETASVTANELMVRAHEARAEWENFPGFTAEIEVATDGSVAAGQLTVTEEGEIKLRLPDAAETEWVEQQLRSLVMHRQPSLEREYNVAFADDAQEHPLGRLIRFNEDRLHRLYRIRDDVITEVHRTMGDSRFTITVLDVSRNPEGEYLPQLYSVSYWDAESGDLKSCNLVQNEWVRVEELDLPQKLLAVTTANDGQRIVRQIRFRDHRLLGSAASE